MPVVVKAKGRDTTNDVIKRFKKSVSATNLVQNAKNRRFYKKPSQMRQEKKNEKRRLRKRYLTIKKMKNVPARMIPRALEEKYQLENVA